jgi:predicted RNA-binding Zn-ribbon protein involved in translation (DUF1610 family)
VSRRCVPATECANCGGSLLYQPAPRYCPQCGQATAWHASTWRTAVRESFDRWQRTLVTLIAHPGRLTLEHIAGRRRRYVPPLRLYLAASFVFFLVVKVLTTAGTAHIVVAPAIDAHGRAITAESDPAVYQATIAAMQRCVDQPGSCSWLRTLRARIGLKGAAQAARPQALAERMIGLAPNAVFVLLPVFAGLSMLAYRARRMRYGTHFVFSLHMHSGWFLALTPLSQLPEAASLFGLLVVLPAHSLWALQKVYGGRWWATLARAAVMVVLYLAALFATVAGLSVTSALLV